MTIKNLRDFKLVVGFASFCIFLLVFLIPNQVGSLTDSDALMPVIVTVFILLLSVLMVIKSVGHPHTEHEDHSNVHRMHTLSLWTVITIMVIYAWLLEWTGFLLTSCIAMVVLFMVYGVRQYFRIFLITLITLGLLYFAFEKLLFAPLPVGRLIENIFE
jgi:hypothetical protein